MKSTRIAVATAALTLVAPLASVAVAQAATVPFAQGEQRITLTSAPSPSDGQTVDFTCLVPAGWTSLLDPAKGDSPHLAAYEGDGAHMSCGVVVRADPIDDAWLDEYIRVTTRSVDKVSVVSKGTDGFLMREIIVTRPDGTTEYERISADGRRVLSSHFKYPTADAASWNNALHERRTQLVTIVKASGDATTKPSAKPSKPKASDKPGRGVAAITGVFDRK